MSGDDLGIHIFTESLNPTMTKLALEELATEKPSLIRLTQAGKSTELSQWYSQNKPQGYSKVAASHREKHCSKCDSRGHTSDECWGRAPSVVNLIIGVKVLS